MIAQLDFIIVVQALKKMRSQMIVTGVVAIR